MKYIYPTNDLYTNEWRKLSGIFGLSRPIDRTNTITDFGFEYHVVTPIPEDCVTKLSFDVIVNNRVSELIQLSSKLKKPLVLLWSGGIDSTTIFCALLNSGCEFTVASTDGSAGEYPLLHAKLTNNHWAQVKYSNVHNQELVKLQEEYIVITGTIGDQIVGTSCYFIDNGDSTDPKYNKLRPELLMPWKEQFSSYVVQRFETQVEAAPININDYADFLWWLNFSFKYQYLQYNYVDTVYANPTLPTLVHFYDSTAFQQWACSNRELNKQFIYNDKPLEYKQVFKDYIYEILRDDDYRNNKQKDGTLDVNTFAVLASKLDVSPATIVANGDIIRKPSARLYHYNLRYATTCPINTQ